MEIKTYSERGIVNSLIYSLDEKLAKDFLKEANPDLNDEDISNITIYLEHSLSDFGDPDIVITYEGNGKKVAVFIEAKVSNGKKWTLKQQYEYYIANENKPENISSNFFRQLALKALLMMTKENGNASIDCKKARIPERIKGKKNNKKIGKNPVVIKFYKEVLQPIDNYWFLGLVPEKDTLEDIKNPEGIDKSVIDNLKLLTWEDIRGFAVNHISDNHISDNHISDNDISDDDKIRLNNLLQNFNWNKGIIYSENN